MELWETAGTDLLAAPKRLANSRFDPCAYRVSLKTPTASAHWIVGASGRVLNIKSEQTGSIIARPFGSYR
jgi:hypothetical protein